MGIEKAVEHESKADTNCNWGCWYSHQRIRSRTGGLGKNGMGTDSELHHYLGWLEYWGESWRLEKTYSYSNFSEKPSANANGKNSQGIIIIIIWCFWYSHQRVHTRTGGLGN